MRSPQLYDLLLRGGTIVTPDGARPADVAVLDGRIAALLPSAAAAEVPAAKSTLDASGRYVLPGLVDSHVHFRTPGLTHKEEWRTGSMAAVAGGVTTVIDMPNTVPPLITPEELATRRRLIEGRSLVDYRCHAGVDPSRVEAMRDWDRAEADSFKVFLSSHHTTPTVVRDIRTLRRIFTIASDTGVTLLFHAEDDAVFGLLDRRQAPPARYSEYERHRPRTGGIVATAQLINLAAEFGVRTHVVHVSTREETDLLAAAASTGIPITFEVTGHHLTFVDADIRRLGPQIRLRPAIRDEADRNRLWEAVRTGEAATVGSDHSPHTAAEKARPVPDVPPGLPGVQELFGTVWKGLRSRWPQEATETLMAIVAERLALAPARLFGLADRKGSIEVGKDADLVIVDPEAPWTMTPGRIHTKNNWSAYQGGELLGAVEATVRRGEVVYRQHGSAEAFGERNGRWLPARDSGAEGTTPGDRAGRPRLRTAAAPWVG
ncbi:dihydroorotase family protein [Streptomyces sp. NPDC019937]|uniref:dihydroorotase n=1 Tax=Streptomyces sp. NPDC019937 TaxID=3154787 RepID=UPI0033F7989D